MDVEYLRALGAIVLPNLGGLVNSQFIKGINKDVWYKSLKRSSVNPPNYVFGPVWSALYSAMGYASYLVWREGGGFQGKAKIPLLAYGVQLLLNWAWTPIFFKKHMLGAAAGELVLTTGAAAATTVLFYNIDKTAGYIMMPYVAWCTFASYLSFRVWTLNKDNKL